MILNDDKNSVVKIAVGREYGGPRLRWAENVAILNVCGQFLLKQSVHHVYISIHISLIFTVIYLFQL